MSNLSSLYKSIEKIMWTDTGLNGDAQRIEQFAWMLFFKIFSDKDKELELLDDNYQSPIPEAYRWDAWAGNDEGITGDELLHFIDRDLFPALRHLDLSTGNRRALIVREVFEGNNNYMKSGTNLRKVLNKLNEIDFNRAKDRHAFGDIYESILKGLQSAGKSGEFYTPRAVTQFICDTLAPKLGETVLDPACGTGGFLTAAVETLKAQAKTVADQQMLQKVKGWEYKPLPFLLATTNLILHDVEVPNITFRDVLDQPLSAYSQKDRVDVVLANPPFGGVVANGNETNFPATFRTKESADLFLVLIMHLLKDGGRAGVVLPDGSLTGDDVKQRVRQKLLQECNLHTIVRLPNSVFQPYAMVPTNLLFFTKGAPTEEIWYYQHRLPESQKSYSKTKPIRREEFRPIETWWNNREESEVAWRVPIQTIIDRGYDLDIKNPHQPNAEVLYTAQVAHDLSGAEDEVKSKINQLADLIRAAVPEQYFFIENLSKIALAPNGVKELKKTLIGLAAQGRLLPQDPTDEPASVLLQKLQAPKVKIGKAGKSTTVPLFMEEEEVIEGPFKIPTNWVWCRTKQISHLITSGSRDWAKYYSTTGAKFVRMSNLSRGSFDLRLDKMQYVQPPKSGEGNRTKLEVGDILVSVTGDVGNLGLIPPDFGEAYINQHTALVRLKPEIDFQFIAYCFLSPALQEQFNAPQRGMKNSFRLTDVDELLIPLAPLAEQHRIVAMLAQLLHHCDVLEQCVRESRRLAEQLLATALREALAPPAGTTAPALAEAIDAPTSQPSRRGAQLALDTLLD